MKRPAVVLSLVRTPPEPMPVVPSSVWTSALVVRGVRRGVGQIGARLRASPPPLPEGGGAECVAFLEWIDDDHFTFLGYREYDFEGEGAAALAQILPESGMGVLRDESVSVFDGLR